MSFPTILEGMELDYERLVENERTKEAQRRLVESLVSMDINGTSEYDLLDASGLLAQISSLELNTSISTSPIFGEGLCSLPEAEGLFLIQETWTDIDVLESAILPTECSPSASEAPSSPAPSLVIDERQPSPEETPVDNEFINRFILRPVTPSDWERESVEPESLQINVLQPTDFTSKTTPPPPRKKKEKSKRKGRISTRSYRVTVNRTIHSELLSRRKRSSKPAKYHCAEPSCKKSFSRSADVLRHVRSIHTKEEKYKCSWPDCDKRFTRVDARKNHYKRHLKQE